MTCLRTVSLRTSYLVAAASSQAMLLAQIETPQRWESNEGRARNAQTLSAPRSGSRRTHVPACDGGDQNPFPARSLRLQAEFRERDQKLMLIALRNRLRSLPQPAAGQIIKIIDRRRPYH